MTGFIMGVVGTVIVVIVGAAIIGGVWGAILGIGDVIRRRRDVN